MATTGNRKRPPTWLEVAVSNGGFRQAIRALKWAHNWAFVREAFGRDPSAEEVAEWWNQSRRTTFREQAAFRECFPTLDTPEAPYTDPKVRERIAEAAKVLGELEAAMRAKRQAADSDLLRTGLLGPTT